MNLPLPKDNHALLKQFASFLDDSGLSAVSVKNYLSDLRNFLAYVELNGNPDLYNLYLNISKYTKEYQIYQVDLFTPANTVNRRLASIRRLTTYLKIKYFEQLEEQNQQVDQKTSTLLNSETALLLDTKQNSTPTSSQKIIDQFSSYLKSEKKTHSTIKNYCSDLYHYFNWIAKHTPFNTHHLNQVLSKEQLTAYVSYLKLSQTTNSVISRRQSSVKRLTSFCHKQGYIEVNQFEYIQTDAKLSPLSWLKRFVPKPKNSLNAPKSRLAKVYYNYHQLPFTPYLHLALLVIATTTMALLAYNQIIKNARPSSAATSLTPPRRQLSFQGRLSDSSGTPIVTTVNVNFKLWDQLSGGTEGTCTSAGGEDCLYKTGTCSVTPDNQGIFNSLIGDGTCGAEIPMSVFSDNRDIYLEVGVGAETLTPRQQIATVGYALNSETLQGYPASAAATINTVPVIDNNGDINIAVASPSIISTSGNFSIVGQSLSLTTATNSGGDIVLQPDALGSGQILAIGGTTTEDTFRITNANLTTGSLLSGYIGNDVATGSGNLLLLSSGATETAKFRVTADGRTTITTATVSAITAALTVNQNGTGDIFTGSASGITKFNIGNSGSINTIDGVAHTIDDVTGNLTLTSNSNTISLNDNVTFAGTTTLNGQTYTWPASAGSNTFVLQTNGSGTLSWVAQTGGTSFWDQVNGTLYPLNSTVDFLLGGQATTSAKFAVLNMNSGTPTATIAGTTANAALFYDGNGNIATTNRQSLVLGNSATYNTTGNILLNPNGIGNIGIGTVLPINLLTLGSFDAATSNSLKQGLFSTDNNLLAQLEGGLYFGRTGITENQWKLGEDFGNVWITKASSDNWNGVDVSSDGKYQTAVVNGGQIYLSNDHGNNWYVTASIMNWTDIAMSSDGKIQTATADNPEQIYVSTDYGDGWTAKDSTRNWSGISMSSDGKIQTAVDYGGQIYVSTDFGDTWTAKDSNRDWWKVAMSSDGKIQTAVVYTGQIYVSTDYGDTWTAKDTTRDWIDIDMSSDGKIQTAADDGGQIYVSTDYGDTWTAKDSNRNWWFVSLSSDGRYQSAATDGDQIYVSTDYGNTWTAKDSARNWRGLAMSSDGKFQTAVENNGPIYISTTSTYLASGNIGIGTSNPSYKLDIATTNNQRGLNIDNTQNIDSTIYGSYINTSLTNPTYSSSDVYGSYINTYGNNLDTVYGLFVTSTSTGIDGNAYAIYAQNGQNYFGEASTFNGQVAINGGASDLVFSGNTSLAETTANNDSGAYLIGAFDEFNNSSSTNVQAVLNDLDDAISNNTGYWSLNAGSLFPKNSTTDFFIGGQATTSAKFAVLNIDSGIPIASISSGLSGVSSYLTADGTLATTNNQTLTIGNSTTGNISIATGTKSVAINSDTWDIDEDGLVTGLTGLTSSGVINFSGLSPSSAVYTDGSSNLTSVAPTTGILGFWQRTSGVLAPWFISDSINLGATATSSALVHLGGTAGESSFFMEPLAIGFDSSASPITNAGIGGTSTALQVDGSILPGEDDASSLGYGSGVSPFAWSRLYLNNGINNAAGTEQVSILNRNLTGGRWNATSTFLVNGDHTATMPTGIEFYTIGDASVSATFTAGGNSTIIGDLAVAGNVTIGAGTGKLDVGTVDPPYTINGEKYATYLSGMIGVKEETTGTIITNEYLENIGYRKTINFNSQPKGSDLWLFSKTTNLKENLSRMSVLLTPSSQAKTWYEIDENKNTLYVYSSAPGNISYRLSAPRFDAATWTNTRTAGVTGFVLNDQDSVIEENNTIENINYSAQIEKIDGQFALIINSQEKRETGNFSSSLIANLRSGLAVISELVTDNLVVNTRLITPLADIKELNAINATISGTLTADNIKSKTIDKLNEQLDILNEKYSTASAILASIQENLNPPLQLSPLSTTSGQLPDELTNDSLTLQTLYTSDILASGSIFTQSLSSFESDLFIQPTGEKPVHILANLLNLYPNGQIVIQGDLLVTGNIFANNLDTRTATISGTLALGINNTQIATDSGKLLAVFGTQGEEVGSIDASGSANFNTLQTSGLVIASQNGSDSSVSGTITSNSTIGTASIATNSAEIFIQNNQVNPQTLIYITPISDTSNQVLFVKSKQACNAQPNCTPGFTVAAPQILNKETSFNYWLVQTK